MPPAAAEPILYSEPSGSGKQHFSLDVKFPVYAIDFTHPRTVVLGGGGGSSRSGVGNRLSSYKIDTEKKQFDLVEEFDLSKTEDAPMSICVNRSSKELVAGINSSSDKLKEGTNENLRLFSFDDKGLKFIKSKQTINSFNEDHYQKVTSFNRSSPNPNLIAIGSTNSQLSLLTYPELKEVWSPINYGEGEEIFDCDFDDTGEMLMATSSTKLLVWSTTTSSSSDSSELQEPLQTITRPVLRPTLTCTFRAAKFGRKETSKNLYTIVNSTPSVRSRKAGRGEKKSFVSLWNTEGEKWELKKTRTISDKPVTAFDVNDDGTLLAFGSSDLSVGVLDAVTLGAIMTILKAHEFPVTSLRFSPNSDLVISGSADNSVKVIMIPPVSERGGSSTFWNVLLTLIILILAVLIQRSQSSPVILAGSRVGV